MRLTRIYYDGSIASGDTLSLPTAASHHLVRVLRYRRGSHVHVFNGRGGEYLATMLDEHPKHAELRIDEFIETDTESSLELTLLQCVSRADRMDFAIQKAVELGVYRIVPVICSRGITPGADGAHKKLQRWRQIASSACEQSGRNSLPEVCAPLGLQHATANATAALKLMLVPENGDGLKQIRVQPASISILVGPEGGLAPDEIRCAVDAGFRPLRFGPRILRTETAGIAALAACQLLWGDIG